MYPIAFFVYLSYLYIISVVINGGGKDLAVILGGRKRNGCWTMLLSGWENVDGLGSEFAISSGVSISELLTWEILKL